MAVSNWVLAIPPERISRQAQGDGYLTISHIEIKILFLVCSDKRIWGCWVKIRLLQGYKKKAKRIGKCFRKSGA